MTDRTADFYCPRCRRYVFSAYTYRLTAAEERALDEEAMKKCACSEKSQDESAEKVDD